MRIGNKFQVVTAASVVGLVAIALLSTGHSSLRFANWWRSEESKSRFEANSEIDKTQAESSKKTADAYQKNRVAQFNKVILSTYALNDKPPKLDWWNSVDRSKKTYVYDKYRKCVGYAFEGKFYFVRYLTKACDQN